MTPQDFFNRLNKDTLNLVDEFYASDVTFKDAVTELKGSEAVKSHYRHQYKHLKSIRWDFRSEVKNGSSLSFEWTMHLAHPALNGGNEYAVEGASVIKLNAAGKAVYHRDYFDVGDFIYSKIPILKWVDAKIKNSLKASENK